MARPSLFTVQDGFEAFIKGLTSFASTVRFGAHFVFGAFIAVTLGSSTLLSCALILLGFSVQYLSTYLSPFLEAALQHSL